MLTSSLFFVLLSLWLDVETFIILNTDMFSFTLSSPDEVAAYELKQKEAEEKKERLYVIFLYAD